MSEDRFTMVSHNLQGKLKLCIPWDSFIEFTLPKQDWTRLREWLDRHDDVEIATAKNNSVVLFNKTRKNR